MRKFLLFLFVAGLFTAVQAQNVPSFWKPVNASQADLQSVGLPAVPAEYKTVQLDFQGISNYLTAAPMEFTDAAQKQALPLDLPMADGQLKRFWVVESPIIAPGLAAKFPAIHTYYGTAADASGTTVRLGVGYDGFHAYLFEANSTEQTIQSFDNGQSALYMVFRNKDLPAVSFLPDGKLGCGVDDADITSSMDPDQSALGQITQERGSARVSRKKYRIAIAAKAEYSNYFNNSIPVILGKITTALNYIVAIQERDFAVRFELVAENDKLIFTNPDTDPYSGLETGDWMNQNQAAVNNAIGSGAYDIGHVFAVYVTGSATGIAGGRICNVFGKARGCSSTNPPEGTYFNLVAAHEMCHQMSGSHTMNNCSTDSNGQLASFNSYEPGSGSSIMGYPGVCGSNDVQGGSDPYFHISNIEQVANYLYLDEGNTCGITEVSDNNQPTATILASNTLSIPIGTPFKLKGLATDEDNDVLTYCWEQYNLGPISPLGAPTGTAPSFRSYPPDTSTTRYFPRLATVAGNISDVDEVLPTYSRDLTFRFTVRDNHAAAGGIATSQISLKAVASAGPFFVLGPNGSGTNWKAGEQKEITWEVAKTDLAPVNCKFVNIKLSIDGGVTFPITLAANVPNTGRHCIVVPGNLTTKGRIMVEAADNVFYDMSNTNLTIQNPSQASFSICSPQLGATVCLPGNYVNTISTSGIGGFNGPITLDAINLPAGVTASFSPNPVQPGADAVLTLNCSPDLAENNYTVTVTGTSNGNIQNIALNLKVIQNNFAAFALETPLNGAGGVDLGPVFKWNGVPDANAYDIQIATNPSFDAGSIISERTDLLVDTFKIPFVLGDGQTIYWRVRPVNECNIANWSDPFVFVTKVQSCNVFTANDLPKAISTNGAPTVESKIVVNTNALLSDVNVPNVAGNHDFLKDLDVKLISPTGTEVQLWKDKCPGSYTFKMGFDDSAPSTFGCPPPNNGNKSKVAGSLGALNGQNASGTWTLRVKDTQPGSGGSISGFQLELCSSQALNAPFLVNNNVLSLASGANEVINTNLLKVDDADNTAAQLIYTLITTPKFGLLQLNGATLLAGDQFTQDAVNNGLLRYFDYGVNGTSDQFRFAATDGNGGLVADIFKIQPIVSAKEAVKNLAFAMSPNPAEQSVRLFFNEALPEDTQVSLINMAGQVVQNWQVSTGAVAQLLNLQGLPGGIYVVAVQNASGNGVQKLVIR